MKIFIYSNYRNSFKLFAFQVKLTPPENSPPIKVSGSNFPRPLNLINLHFHWGVKKGSEHTIDGKSYGLELHIVNKNKFGDVAVLGFFFEETKIDNPELNHLLEVAISLDQQTRKFDFLNRFKFYEKCHLQYILFF